jgi:hypothetical protein
VVPVVLAELEVPAALGVPEVPAVLAAQQVLAVQEVLADLAVVAAAVDRAHISMVKVLETILASVAVVVLASQAVQAALHMDRTSHLTLLLEQLMPVELEVSKQFSLVCLVALEVT